jgi:hypothetical protein
MKEDIIEFYEGKLLTSYENNNIIYLEKFCTCTDNREQYLYLVTKTTQEDILRFRNKEITLNELFHEYSDDFDYYISQEERGIIVEVLKIKGSQIPDSYKAQKDVFYEVELAYDS